MSVKTIFTALAEQVRRLSGRTGNLGVESMTEALAGVTPGVDASGLTASASDVIGDKTFIGSSGGRQTGTMVNNGAVSATLDATTKSYTVPAGYHNGNGKVRVVTQTKSVTPGAEKKTVYPDSGKLLSAVTVAAADGGYTGTFTIGASDITSIWVDTGVSIGENDMMFIFMDATCTSKRDCLCAYRMTTGSTVSYESTTSGSYVRIESEQALSKIEITYSDTRFKLGFADHDGVWFGNFASGDVYRWVLIKR